MIHYSLLIVVSMIIVFMALLHPLLVFVQHVMKNPASALYISIVDYTVIGENAILNIELKYDVPTKLEDFRLTICSVEKNIGELNPGNYTFTIVLDLKKCEVSRDAELSFRVAGLYSFRVVVKDWLKLEK